MKIIFLGTPDFAIPSLEALIKTEWLEVLEVITQPDRPANRGKNILPPPVKIFAEKYQIPVFQTEKISKDLNLIDKIKESNPDYLITCAYGQILNQEVLNICPVLNVHASLLPKYRGAAPINWAILNGETETGITIMKTELGLDSGPILISKKCSIEENETSEELTKKLSKLGAETLINGLTLLRESKGVFVEQNHTLATKAPMLKKELGHIDWSKKSGEIHNKVRGLRPWPSAYTTFNKNIIKITETRLTEESNTSHTEQPGKILRIENEIIIKTGDGHLKICKLQSENKKIMNAKEWANGTRIKPGDCFV